MDFASIVVSTVSGGGFIISIGILIYLLFRRLQIKEAKHFEDTENYY